MALLEVGVTMLTGVSCTIMADASWAVREIKVAAEEQLGVATDEQTLIFRTTPVVDSDLISTLQDMGEGSLEFTMLRLSKEMVTWIRKLKRASHYSLFLQAPDHIKNSRDVVYAAVCSDGKVLDYVPETFQHDRGIVMAAVKQNCEVFQNIAEEFRADREIALLAVRGHGKLLQYAASELHLDRQVIAAAVATESRALLLYPPDCWDVDLVLAAMPKARDAAFRSFMRDEKVAEIFGQRDFLMAALEKDPMILQFASKDLKKDKELVLHAVERCWETLQYASCELQSDLDIVTSALAQNPLALQFAAARFADDRDLVLEAVSRDAQALKFASRKLQADAVISATAYATHRKKEAMR